MKTLNVILVSLVGILTTGCSKSAFNASSLSSVAPDMSLPSAKYSTMAIETPCWADGQDAAYVVLNIRNAKNEPLSGVAMNLFVSGSQNTVIPCNATDATGVSHCRFYSTKAEWKNVEAQGAITLSGKAQFNIPPRTTNLSQIVSSTGWTTTSSGQHIISTTGITEAPTAMRDNGGNLRIQSSILGDVTSR